MKTEFLSLLQITSATGEALFKVISDLFAEIDVSLANCIGFASDGANNVCGVHNSVLSRLKQVTPHVIFVKCTCHSLALCAEHAFKKLPSNLEFLLAEVARWFKCSTLRREEFKQIFKVMNDELLQPSRFITPSTTRWLVKGKCIFSILSQWEELKAYFAVINDKDKNYHARVLCEMLADCRNFLYLTYVLPIIQDFEKVNAAFQASNANPVKVFEDLMQLHKSLQVRLYGGETGATNSEILPLDMIHLGVKFERELLNKKNKLCVEDVNIIKNRCRDFLVEENSQLEKRLSDNWEIISSINSFSPSRCLNQMRKNYKDIATNFFDITAYDCDTLASQYNKLIMINWKEEFPDGCIPEDPVAFWSVVRTYKNALDEHCFEELATTALTAYCLPLSNATVERVFSHVTAVKNKLRNKLSTGLLSAIIRIKTRLHFSGNCCKNFTVTDRMLSLFNDSMYTEVEASSSATASTSRAVQMSMDYEDFDEVIAVPF